MKRFLAVVLAVAMVAAFVPAAVADDPPKLFDLDEITTQLEKDETDISGDDWVLLIHTPSASNPDHTIKYIKITHAGPITLTGNSSPYGVLVDAAKDITLAKGTKINATNGHALQVPGDSKITGEGNDITITGGTSGIAANGGNVTITGTLGEITSGFRGISVDGGGGSVTISGTIGNITGTGGGGTSGISATASVEISGTVTSISGTTHGILIGGSGGSVTISGTVGNISGGTNGISTLNGKFTLEGNGVAFVSGTILATPDHKSGILFVSDEGNETGTVYGNVTLQGDLTIPSGVTLTVPTGASLTVPDAVTLTVATGGKITNKGTLTNNGEIDNKGTIDSRSGNLTGKEIDGDVISPPEPDGPEDDTNNQPSTDTTTTTETSETPFFAYFEPTPPVSDADTPSDWAKAAVEEARQLGLVPEHLDGSWRRWLNRAEFSAFAVLLYEHLDGRTITAWSLFDDTTDVNVEKLAGLGIVKGDGTGKFNPDGNFSREMALTLMYNILVRLGYYLPPSEPSFSDADDISPWAREAIGALQRAGIIKGDGTRFNAQEIFSREMGVVTMAQILEWVG